MGMTDKQKKAALKKQNDPVYCQGCGKRLDPENEDAAEIEYVKTKRGTKWFFHTFCMKDVWKRKIVWEEKDDE